MIFHRTTFLELVPAFLITLGVLTAILMMEKVYRLVSLAVEKSFSLGEVGLMLVYTLPQAISVTMPMAVVGGVFITVIRQSMDSEIISMRASGRSMWSYAVPFFLFGLLTTAVHLTLTLWLQPGGNQAFGALQVRVIKARAEEQIVPGRLNFDFGGKVIRVGSREPNHEFTNVFVADQDYSTSPRLILADRGRIEVDEEAQQVVFRLRNGTMYLPGGDNTFDTTRFDRLSYVLAFESEPVAIENSNWRMPTLELIDRIRTRDPAVIRRTRRVLELFIRFTTPWICLAFAVAAVPMAMVEPRSGRASSLARALILVLAYYVIWISFKDLAHGRRVSAAILGLPPLMIFVYGLLRTWQLNRDIHLRLRLSFWRG